MTGSSVTTAHSPGAFPGPLTGLRVVEVGDLVTAPFTAKILAGLGATVIKVEPPRTGDRSRIVGPFPQDEPDPERSGLYIYLNAKKRGVTLDLTTSTGRALLGRPLADADVLVENVAPQDAGEYIDLSMWEALAAHQPVGLLNVQFNGRPGFVRANDHPLYAPYGVYRCLDADEVTEGSSRWRPRPNGMRCARRWAIRPGARSPTSRTASSAAGTARSWTRTSRHGRAAGTSTSSSNICRHWESRAPHAATRRTASSIRPSGTGERMWTWSTRSSARSPCTAYRYTWSGTSTPPLNRAPTLGEHTHEVLREVLAVDDAEIERLGAAGILQ